MDIQLNFTPMLVWYEELCISAGLNYKKIEGVDFKAIISEPGDRGGSGGNFLLCLNEYLSVLYINVEYSYSFKFNPNNKPGEYFIINYSESDHINFYDADIASDKSEYLTSISKMVTVFDANLIKDINPVSDKKYHALRIIMKREYAKSIATNTLGQDKIDMLFNPKRNSIFLQYDLDIKSLIILKKLDSVSIHDPAFRFYLGGATFSLLGIFQEVLKVRQRTVILKIRNEDLLQLELSVKYLIQAAYGKFPGVDKLCEIALMSNSKYKLLFSKVYAVPPHKFFINKKMLLAKQLLSTSDMSITNIVTELGYESPSSFTRQFKKHFGVLPKEFKI